MEMRRYDTEELDEQTGEVIGGNKASAPAA